MKIIFLLVFVSLSAQAFGPQVVRIFENLHTGKASCYDIEKSKELSLECEKLAKQQKSYDVFKDPKSKNLIGKLTIIPNFDGKYDFYFNFIGKDKSEISLKNLITNCNKDNLLPEFLISKKHDGDYVSLPSGPWGNEAWIKEGHSDFLQTTLTLDFKEIEQGKLNYENNKFSLRGVDSKNPAYIALEEPADDLEPFMKIIYFNESELWDANGDFVPDRSCGSD